MRLSPTFTVTLSKLTDYDSSTNDAIRKIVNFHLRAFRVLRGDSRHVVRRYNLARSMRISRHVLAGISLRAPFTGHLRWIRTPTDVQAASLLDCAQ